MSCYSCGSQFGIFKKEHGCKNCGFSFCNKCLSDKAIAVPKRNNAKHHVCQKCFKILTGAVQEDSEKKQYELPAAYLKRMTALKERECDGAAASSSTGVGGAGAAPRVPQHLQRLEQPDREIAMRLEKLKASRQPNVQVSDSDIRTRLAKLKGEPNYSEQKPQPYQPPDRRTQVEQVDDLLKQVNSEVDIDARRPDPVRDIEARLARLKSDNETSTSKTIADANNTNQEKSQYQNTTSSSGSNDLSKVDKMGSFSKPYDKNIGNSPKVWSDDTRTSSGEDNSDKPVSAEEMRQLMEQASRELEEDARREIAGLHRDKDIAGRLRALQGTQAGSHSQSGEIGMTGADSDDENEDAETKRILQRYLEEARLDEKAGLEDQDEETGSPYQQSRGKNKKKSRGLNPLNSKEEKESDSDYDDSDELPYCCLCTEDATIRCRDCDLDLFCRECFRASHQEIEIFDHRTTGYRAPKGYTR